MISPAEQEYWPEFLRRLADTSLAELAAEYGATPAELEAALAGTTGDRPVQQEAWWPEVLRLHEAGSLRDLARRFGTNPRRLRRGLARAAVRVHGEAVAVEGMSRFEPIRERLGKEPDKTLAAEVGVTVEAIKGERRRLGIEPYRMRPDAEEWGEKVLPKREKPRPRRRWQDAPEPEIFRRTGASAPAAVEQPPVVERAVPAVSRTVFRRMSAAEEDEPAAAEQGRVVAFRGFSVGGAEEPEAGAPPMSASADRPRRRIVRPSQPDSDENPSPAALPRLGRAPAAGAVRVISHGAAPHPALGETEAAPPVAPPQAPSRRRTVRADRAEAPPVPNGVIHEASEFDLPPEADAVPLALVEPPLSAPHGDANGAYAWQVEVPMRRQPLLVVADNIAEALQIASDHLGAEAVAEARAWRVGAVLRDEA
ncbi:MAG: hypothetical protein ABIO70_22895 [Pseudomonadota bacterium]